MTKQEYEELNKRLDVIEKKLDAIEISHWTVRGLLNCLENDYDEIADAIREATQEKQAR